METEKGPMVARSWGEGGMHGGARRSTEHFQVSENTLCDTVMVDTHVIAHLLRPIKCTSPRVNPNVNRGLRVMCMVNLGPWVVINVPSGGGVDSGGSWVSMDARVCMEAEVSMEARGVYGSKGAYGSGVSMEEGTYGKSLYPPFDFSVNLKLLENRVFQKNQLCWGRMGTGGVRALLLLHSRDAPLT